MFNLLREDAGMYFRAWRCEASLLQWLKLVLITPGYQLAISIRFQRAIAKFPVLGALVSRILWYFTVVYFGCDIDPKVGFAGGLYLPHPIGIVIGGEWDIGQRVTILQNVTLGRNGRPSARSAVGCDVIIGAGSVLVGEMNIGDRAQIGANAVVLSSVPSDCTAVGVPAKVIQRAKPS